MRQYTVVSETDLPESAKGWEGQHIEMIFNDLTHHQVTIKSVSTNVVTFTIDAPINPTVARAILTVVRGPEDGTIT